ncbi:hypothetical protein METHPM2_30006 [Pseudomonas sp. PM2]
MYHCTFHIAFDSTLQPLAFNLGFDQFDACHEISPEAMDFEGRFAFHETFNLHFIQTCYDDHGFSELPARDSGFEKRSNTNLLG